MRPRSGLRSPSTHSIVVVFPAPFGPISPKISLPDVKGPVVDRHGRSVPLADAVNDDDRISTPCPFAGAAAHGRLDVIELREFLRQVGIAFAWMRPDPGPAAGAPRRREDLVDDVHAETTSPTAQTRRVEAALSGS